MQNLTNKLNYPAKQRQPHGQRAGGRGELEVVEGLSQKEEEKKRERPHGHEQQCDDCGGEVEEGIERIVGDGKF